jgi:hypothetical protein
LHLAEGRCCSLPSGCSRSDHADAGRLGPLAVTSSRSSTRALPLERREKEPTKIWTASSTPDTGACTGCIPIGSPPGSVDGNRLAFLASANGSEQTSYGSFLGISSVSVTPSGKEILFSSATRSGACGSGPASEVDRLNTDTLSSTPIVGYAVTPLVSPDGRYVAYGITCDGPALGLTNLATGQNYRTDPLGGRKSETSANIESVEVLGWSPDSKRLLYRLGLEGDTVPHYYVGRLWPMSVSPIPR